MVRAPCKEGGAPVTPPVGVLDILLLDVITFPVHL